MHHFKGDWTKFIDYAAVWNGLSREARRLFLTLKVDIGVDAAEFGPHLEPLLRARLLAYSTDIHVRLNNQASAFRRAMRSMGRHLLFSNPTHAALEEYFRDNFTRNEIEGLTRDRGWHRGNLYELVGKTTTDQWMLDFVSGDPEAWAKSKMDSVHPLPLENKEAYLATRKFVQSAIQWQKPVPFADLPASPSGSAELLSFAIDFCIRFALLFPALTDDLTPVIGLWPSARTRLQRPQPTAPREVVPQQEFELAYRLEDMTTLLVAICGEGLRVRAGDHGIFEKARTRIEADLLALPEWLDRIYPGAGHGRLEHAKHVLYEMKLIEGRGRSGQDLRLEATNKAESWLAESPAKRLMSVFEQFHAKKLLDYSLKYVIDRNPEIKLVDALMAAFAALDTQRFVACHEFFQWNAICVNPFLEGAARLGASKVHLDWSGIAPSTENMETEWRRFLSVFFLEYLLPFGAIKIGIGSNNVPCFALTEAGRYLLGLADSFEYGQVGSDANAVVVQPNFDVVFLQPSPLAEATIVRFAERKGTGLGALFKITKASVLSAASTGVTRAQVLDTLRTVSSKALPANVEREITGWFESCRKIKVKSTILIHCPDPQTAARVVAFSGRKAVLLNETVVELQDAKYKPNLLKKLRSEGIFTGGS